MISRIGMPRSRMIEVGAVVVIYVLFAIVGVYGSQTTMNIDVIGPPDGAELRSSPVELIAKVTIGGAPVTNVTMTFTVELPTAGRTETERRTDNEGIAGLLLQAMPGDYTWHVAATRKGYPTIVSSSRRFSVKLSLVVEQLLPSMFINTASPVDFKARVTDMSGNPVQSANVAFYVDSMMIGSNFTDQNGIARLSKPLTTGRHVWFASADKDGEGGLSDMTIFVVGQLMSLETQTFATITLQQRAVQSPSNRS
jgi:hypothetical protein